MRSPLGRSNNPTMPGESGATAVERAGVEERPDGFCGQYA